MMEIVVNVPPSLSGPSMLLVPTLPPIPGSAAPTPMERSEEGTPDEAAEPEQPQAGPSNHEPGTALTSRRSSLAPMLGPVLGSYFPAVSPESPRPALAYTPSASGTTTPGDRPRPAPIAIPLGTPDEPLFSAYPQTGASTSLSEAKGKERAFAFPTLTSFSLRDPAPRRRGVESSSDNDGASTDQSTQASSMASRPKTRRRASTISHTPEHSPPLTDEPPKRRRSFRERIGVASPKQTLAALRRRRASLDYSAAQTEVPLPVDAIPHWPTMAAEVSRRLDPHTDLPFSYHQPAASDYTLQSVSTLTTIRPLGSVSPPSGISPRKSSLPLQQPMVLGLTDLAPVEFFLPEDMHMPHAPPPRRSSISHGDGVRTARSSLGSSDGVSFALRRQDSDDLSHSHGSLLSSSLTTDETSASAELFSPATSVHPLSSATTSLSRSAKSGKESEEVKDTALTAVRLQRSLEWEVKQVRHRRKLEKRKMVLLELVETEVAYADDLKTLVQVYLPQLYALPGVSERTADMIARNAKQLLVFHEALVVRMVDVMKEEGLGYELPPTLDAGGTVEKVSRKLSGILVESVSLASVELMTGLRFLRL